MALQKEIWINSIIEGLFADNTFASRSVDHSAFVNDKTVHVPNAGAAPNTAKNRSSFPATITTREDIDLSYSMDEYTTDPIRIPHAETVELSYSKRESVVRGSRAALQDAVHNDLIYKWIPTGIASVPTTGAAKAAHIPSATGTRQALTKNDILEVKMMFDMGDVPQQGRCILLDAIMYNQLLNDLTSAETNAFLACANVERGIIGNLYGFDFYMRSKVAKTAANGTLKLWSASAAATDSAAGLAWHEDMVSRALGETELFDNTGDPTYYGDIVSALVRAGGSNIRNDKKGLCLIYQATPSN